MGTETPEEKDASSLVRNRRTDAMFVAAYGASMWFVYLVVYEPKINEYAQGVLTLALGTFLGYLTAMYNFETGTTRGAQARDAKSSASKDRADSALIEIAKATPVPAPATELKADDVTVKAAGDVTVETKP